ncbi:MAG TPA: histidine kinase [Solirubrobacteraceae bacterium]|nr:histidine kinase [Solirubrobacteraceae bacterium]
MTTSPKVRPATHAILADLGSRLAWAIDAVIVAAIVAGGLVRGPNQGGPHGWLWSIGLAVPLLARRRWPVGVFGVIAALALVQWTADQRSFGDAALLFALYTVAASQPLVVTAAAAAVLEAGIGLAVARWAGQAQLDAFIALSALATAAGAIGINARHRRALVASLHDRATRLEHERDQQGRLSAAAERSRIAREMHDIVAHNLSVMIALADGASYAVHSEPDRAEAAMRTASRTGRQALTEMRRLLGILRDEPVDEGLSPQPGLPQVDALVEQVRSAGLPVSYARSDTPPGEVPAGLELAAYRIVQEALTNTLKHAGAGAAAVVSLVWARDRLCIEVRDTGRPTEPAAAEGGGLRGMRERAAVYDGTLDAGPSESGGWRVRAELVVAGAASVRGEQPAVEALA